MLHAAKLLAVTAIDLYEDSATRDAILAEFTAQAQRVVQKPNIPPGPPPVPKDLEDSHWNLS